MFGIIKFNGRYLENRKPTTWADDELLAEPLRMDEIKETVEKIMRICYKRKAKCIIQVEMLQ